jgi:phosphate transport system permease protein
MARPGSFWSRGIPYVWGTGSMVILILILLAGLLGIIFVHGLGHFWPHKIVSLATHDGARYLGRVAAREEMESAHGSTATRTKYEIGGRDVYGLDFKWFDDSAVVIAPADSAVVFERLSDGSLYGYLDGFVTEDGAHQGDRTGLWEAWTSSRRQARADFDRVRDLERQIAGRYRPLNDIERLAAAAASPVRLAQPEGHARLLALEARRDSLKSALEDDIRPLHDSIQFLAGIDQLRKTQVRLADGSTREIPSSHIVSAYRPNRMNLVAQCAHYASSSASFLLTWPREANTGGGILPALLGTVLMVLLMTVAVVPLGVVAALYLHEYATDSFFLRLVRLAVSNLAGVPSIVFGVFGLGFFVYFLGAGIDRLFFADYLPSPTFGTGGLVWASLTLALLTVPVVIVATEEGLAAVPRAYRDGSLALGATRFQTLRRIVVPHAMPGILTGVILAVSRGAGEVAPLMLTGVVPLVSDLPVDAAAPFLHLERKFMHLGFHIYDVGFQSPNVEAAKPLVYSTTLVLILLVVVLNAVAIIMRNQLRRRSRGASV